MEGQDEHEDGIHVEPLSNELISWRQRANLPIYLFFFFVQLRCNVTLWHNCIAVTVWRLFRYHAAICNNNVNSLAKSQACLLGYDICSEEARAHLEMIRDYPDESQLQCRNSRSDPKLEAAE